MVLAAFRLNRMLDNPAPLPNLIQKENSKPGLKRLAAHARQARQGQRHFARRSSKDTARNSRCRPATRSRSWSAPPRRGPLPDRDLSHRLLRRQGGQADEHARARYRAKCSRCPRRRTQSARMQMGAVRRAEDSRRLAQRRLPRPATTLPEKETSPTGRVTSSSSSATTGPADILFQCSDNTWQAYNRWPDNYSIYTNPKGRKAPGATSASIAPMPSTSQIYDNPQSHRLGRMAALRVPAGLLAGTAWLRRHLLLQLRHAHARHGLKCKAFLSVGHDEYWDIRQYDSVVKMRDAGVNLLFLSGNAVCWVTPQKPSTDGRPNRIMFRGGPYGGKYKFAEHRESETARSPSVAPTKATLSAPATSTRSTAAATGSPPNPTTGSSRAPA